MPNYVELTMVIGPSDPHERHAESEIDREGEDDGITEVVAAPASNERTSKTTVQVLHIRNFYPRKKRSDGQQPVGTRITFVNGSGMAVTETYDEVKSMLNPTIN
jgi:hypothetical protein